MTLGRCCGPVGNKVNRKRSRSEHFSSKEDKLSKDYGNGSRIAGFIRIMGVNKQNLWKRMSGISKKFKVNNNVATYLLLISSLLLFLLDNRSCMVEGQTTAAGTGGGNVGEAKAAHLQGKREDLFSSTSKLEDLIEHELQIVDLLDTFVEYTISRTNIIKSYVKSQKQFLINGRTHPKEVVEHPVDAYLLVRRLTADWEDVQMSLNAISNYSTGVHSWIDGFRKGTNFPQGDDLNGAAQALVRLQDTYQLDMPALARGNVISDAESNKADNENDYVEMDIRKLNALSIGFQSSNNLTSRDMLFLGRHASSQGLYHRAVQWLEQAENLANAEQGQNSTNLLTEIGTNLQNAIETHDDVLERQGPRGVTWKTNPVPINPTLANSAKYSFNNNTRFQVKLYQRQTEEEETDHFARLCRGEKLRPPGLTAALKCRLDNTAFSYLLISPLKIEEESLDPYIVVIHDFITASQADEVIKLGKPKLFRSRHRHHQDEALDVVSHKRVSQNAWIKDWEHPLMGKLTRRVHLVTGLKAVQPKEAEDYQIANYGLGGLYVPHTDHLMNNPDKSIYTPWERFVGDRIATLMIYLSDVDAGGATVFTRAGVTLWPKKGSAAFWWNLDRSGIGDDNTRHGACPVLKGNKWVSNKWIRFNEQFGQAPCGLHSLDKHKRP